MAVLILFGMGSSLWDRYYISNLATSTDACIEAGRKFRTSAVNAVYEGSEAGCEAYAQSQARITSGPLREIY
jgi:hypothetical protein